MSLPTSETSKPCLRVVFDHLADLSPAAREARLSTLNLSSEEKERLNAMLIFDDLSGRPAEDLEHDLERLNIPTSLKTRVCDMLHVNNEVPQLIAAAATINLESTGGDVLAESMVGTSIGTFRLVDVIGHGGSSVVFRAERPVGDGTQVVALKLLRTGLYADDSQARFRREQSLLTRLTHPNIASLIEGGVSSAGIPYIAMELVDGLPITRAADTRQLNLAQRLSWFVTLCRTIEAAHIALVIHRDLKPSNVIVAADGTLKILDFGIAELVDRETDKTNTHSTAMTPEYAAPEQFTRAELTTAVDVYALGVILTELLTGKRSRGNSKVSVLASGDGTNGTPPGLPERYALSRLLRGELDNILATALAGEPDMRYRSAGAFADDIERFLQGRPVRAHPLSDWYRTKKFVTRNRVLVSLSATFVFAILTLLTIAIDQASAAKDHAHRADAQAERAEAARDLLVSAFDAAGADLPRDLRPSAQDIVDQATSKVLQRTELPVALRIDLLLTLARVSKSMGSYNHALDLLDRIDAIDGGQHLDNPLWWRAIVLRAWLLVEKGQTRTAVALLQPMRSQLASRHDSVGVEGTIVLGKALLHEGQADEGLGILHQAVLTAQSAQLGDVLLSASVDEATQLLNAQHFAEGLERANAALLLWHDLSSVPNQSIIELYGTIALAAEAAGDISRAEDSYKEAIVLGDRFFDKPSPASAWNVGMYGSFLIAQGRFDEAAPYAQRGLAMRRAVFGDVDPRTLSAVATMAKFHAGKHDFAAAVKWLSQGVDTCRANSVHDVICPRLLAFRGRAMGRMQRFANAERDLHEALDWQRELSGSENPPYAFVLDNLLVVQILEQHYNDAVKSADTVLAINKKVKGGMIQSDLSTRFYRATALYELKRKEEALTEILDIEPKYSKLFPRGVSRFDMLALKARALASAKRGKDAKDAAQAALSMDRKSSRVHPKVKSELQRILVRKI